MFDAPADAWYLWLGVTAASVAAFGVATGLPATAPPDAQRVADTVDSVAASPHEATGQYPLDATAVRLGTAQVSLRTDSGATHATFEYGPVTPVTAESPLWAVLHGAPPNRTFDTPADFRAAATAARTRDHRWESAETVLVRHAKWEGVDVVLVGA